MGRTTETSKRSANESISPRSSKNPRIEEVSTASLDNLNHKIDQLASSIITSKQEILDEIATIRTDLSNILERVDKLESQAADVITLRAEMSELKQKIDRQENAAISVELLIHGIPSQKNLLHLFDKICTFINIKTPNVNTIYRIKRKEGDGRDATIKVKLLSAFDRNFVLRSIANFRRNNNSLLLLNNIGIPTTSNAPIFINENLTKENSKLMSLACKYKREKKISTAFSIRGLVYVKILRDDAAIHIKTQSELEDLINSKHNFRTL